MNHAQHIAATELCLFSESLLTQSSAGLVAAEAMWGAAVHAIDAINHARGVNRHAGSNATRRNILRFLEEGHGLGPDLTDAFKASLIVLHNHFYTGRLSEAELGDDLQKGRDFVTTLLELSARDLSEE